MSAAPIDIQKAFDQLSAAEYRTQAALLGFAGWAAKHIADHSGIPYATAADEFRQIAEGAKRQEAAIAGDTAQENPILLSIAVMFEAMAEGKLPAPFGVIDGGKDD